VTVSGGGDGSDDGARPVRPIAPSASISQVHRIGEIRKRGIGASAGIAIGRAYVVDRRRRKTPRRHVSAEEIEVEIARLKRAIAESDSQLARIKDRLLAAGDEHSFILEAHQLMLHDVHLVDETVRVIRTEQVNAEWALKRTVEGIKQIFDTIDDDYFRERRSDVDFVGDRLMRNLLGEDVGPVKPPPDAVVVAHDLSPADTAQLHHAAVAALITDVGGKTSHTSIIARAHEIPAVVGLEDVTAIVGTGDLVIVDGSSGLVLLNPAPQTVAHFRARARREAALGEALLANRDLPAETLDGVRLRLLANVDVVDEVAGALDHGAEGVGLYRSEFLFMGRPEAPTEAEHFEHARAALVALGGRPLTIRTFDLGGDKASVFGVQHEPNPALGLRSIRLCLAERGLALFRSQLLGILRASAYGPIRLMFPMISGVGELREAKAVLRSCQDELRKRGEPFNEQLPVGVMIEMPSAAMTADHLAAECDFFSIGTNDLIQYALAIDRANEHVGYLYRPLHPGLLRMLHTITQAANARGIPVAMCGEMAGESILVGVLLGLGLTELSMNASAIPLVKSVLRATSAADARRLTEKALTLGLTDDVEQLVKEHMARVMPE
jgi:phosphotransferase system enzyme I (PtsI)